MNVPLYQPAFSVTRTVISQNDVETQASKQCLHKTQEHALFARDRGTLTVQTGVSRPRRPQHSEGRPAGRRLRPGTRPVPG